MAPIDVLRKEVLQYIDKVDEKTLRMVLAILKIAQEDDEEIKDGKNTIRKGVKNQANNFL